MKPWIIATSDLLPNFLVELSDNWEWEKADKEIMSNCKQEQKHMEKCEHSAHEKISDYLKLIYLRERITSSMMILIP